MIYRHGKKSAILSFIPVGVFYIAIAVLILQFIYPKIYLLKNKVLITLTIFAMWRYGWMVLNYLRAFIFRFYYYKKLKQKISRLPYHRRYPKHIYFMIPSYKEESWVSIEAFRSIIFEVEKIPSDVTIVVSTATDEEDAVISKVFEAYKSDKKINLIFQHQSSGKRIAMGHALRTIAREYYQSFTDDPNSVTIFMDGDSYLESGFLEKLLPFFAINPKLGALTTNEVAFIDSNSKWYKEWFNLKFGQRHILFQSHSLSNKVMTLTGRLSAYRTNVVIKEDFIRIIENDIITHPLYGKFRFLMGDDKSSWFYLLKNRFDMLYLPDILCYSLESRDGKFLELSRSLPFRWNGNTLRNNTRALKLGMRTTGVFIWFVILDQRLNMWTSLVGIFSAIILAIFKSIYYLLFFFVWILFIRVFQLFIISFGGHKVSFYTLPLMLYSQWVGAFVKINAFYDLANQKWSKNGVAQSSDDDTDMIKHPLVGFVPKLLKYSSFVLFILVLIFSHGVISMPKLNAVDFQKQVSHYDKNMEIIDLNAKHINFKGVDAANIINSIINNSTAKSLLIKLPNKIIHIYTPIKIARDNVILEGSKNSVIISHLKKPSLSAILVNGMRDKKIGFLKANISKGRTVFNIELLPGKILSKYILLREPNDNNFLNMLGSKRWHKKYPYLREEIVHMLYYDVKNQIVMTKKPILINLDAKTSEIYSLKMVENVHLKNFMIKQVIDGDDISRYSFVYKNLLPDFQVSAISFYYASSSSIENVKIFDAGKHPLVFENSYDLLATNLVIDGSWNKGKGGSGYFRMARCFYSEVRDCNISNIRHLTLQWSSAGNHLHHLSMGVDINLHGGYAHDNYIDHITFDIPKKHHWRYVYQTPNNARWAPPDGKNFIDKETIKIRK